ncbi:MAG: PD40 domain-containing protein [Defluviicoccus sp.]|nr:MAG: PD40 domain-containing protein [Defluviicoccus sp.]
MSISRVSTSSSDQQANGESYFPTISANGQFIAFQSQASNLVSGDTNGAIDIFVKNLNTGLVTLASTTASGVLANNASYFPSISGNGRLVVFQGLGSNLVAGDTNGQSDIFVKDLQTGALTRVSTTSSGGQAQGMSHSADISDNGSTVAFISSASNLVAGIPMVSRMSSSKTWRPARLFAPAPRTQVRRPTERAIIISVRAHPFRVTELPWRSPVAPAT